MHCYASQAGNQNHEVDLVIVDFSVIFAVHPKIQPRNQDQVGCYNQDDEDNGAKNVY